MMLLLLLSVNKPGSTNSLTVLFCGSQQLNWCVRRETGNLRWAQLLLSVGVVAAVPLYVWFNMYGR